MDVLSPSRCSAASVPVIALMLVAACAPAQQRELAATPAGQADLVERSLLPAVRVAGRQYAPATIAERLQEYGVPAVSIAVIDQGALAWARAYGTADMTSGRAATTATLFQAASMSKPVASTAALQLVQEGILALDTPVNESLRSWQVPENAFTAGHPVTLRHLLTHTAGLTVSGFPGYRGDASIPTLTQILDGAPPANTPPVRVGAAPGTRLKYSGGGMTVMQLLLTDVTGKDFHTLMRERVLRPVGMHNSTWEQPLSDHRARDAAAGHQTTGSPVEGKYHVYPELAAAGLWTTPTDLAGWVEAIQRSLQGKADALLSRETAGAMVTAGPGGWGLGVQVMGSGDSLAFTHSGGNAGFRGLLVGFAEGGRGAVVMTNSDAGSRLVNEIMQAIARAYDWPGFRPTVIVPVGVTPEMLHAYAGTYELAGGPRVRVAVEGSALWLTLPWGERRELVPTGNDAFGSPEGGSGRFLHDGQGRVSAMVLGDDQLQRVQ
jgi:CubicO group peptidase (beta-lactamase class C family)